MVAMDTPVLAMASALAMASCPELRPVRKMYRFQCSPVMLSATAGSTSSTLFESPATRQVAQPRRARRRADDQIHLVVGVELGDLLLGDVGLELVVLHQHLDLAPEHFHLAPRGVFQAELE